ncbi:MULTISPECIES: FHA domain-containing protein [Rhodomicrobium]|uniref:FHA domain-containing protein n=1 Tax=Rhodomicrobium TaxID=1068 RepID=UPI000B4BF7AF|nr:MULTISPECIES: FHA domain-containing protein [Rhodomicrobium]
MQITIYKLYDFFESYDFQRGLELALHEAGIVAVAYLKDDEKVMRAALLIHDSVLPDSVRMVVGLTIGKDGFVQFIFRIRDKLVEQDRLDFAWLDLGEIKILLLSQMGAGAFSDWVWMFTGRTTEGRTMMFEFAGPGKQSEQRPFLPSFIVGRSAEHCHIVLPDPRVSRRHAELSYFADKGLCVRDLASTNGTYLDGARLDDAFRTLQHGAEIGFGKLLMRVSVNQ